MTDRDDLLRRIDLTALLDELSPSPPTRLGRNARWRCIDPRHEDRHPSISMFTDAHGVQRWRCWSGGHGGTAIDALLVALGGTVRDSIAELERRAGLSPQADWPRSAAPPPRPVVEPATPVSAALLEYVSACERILWRPAGRAILDYLTQKRGLAPDVLEVNHVGADPGPRTLTRAPGLPRRGPAAVLPGLDPTGNVNYAQARYLAPRSDGPRYDNPASYLAVNPRISWTTPARRADNAHLLVCEGTMDALTTASAQFSAVAVLGAAYVDDLVARRIRNHAGGRTIVIAFDGDNAGRLAARSLSEVLARSEVTNQVLALPANRDINAVLRDDSDWLRRQVGDVPAAPSMRHALARRSR